MLGRRDLLRVFILLALLLGTLPAPAAAAPACHEMAGMTMEHEAPASQPEAPPIMGKTLCVGCIAPSTMKSAAVAAPIAPHRVSGPARPMTSALLTPEPPPPRG